MIGRFSRLLLLLSCVIPGLAGAHDSSLATLQVIHLDKTKWVFELKTPLYGLDQSLRQYLEAKSDEPVVLLAGTREYKERLVEYIKDRFDVTVRGSEEADHTRKLVSIRPDLGAGRLKLDNHMSALIFEIKDMPAVVEQLSFRFDYMSSNAAQNNIVRLIDGNRSQRYILNSANDFSAVNDGFFLSEELSLGLWSPSVATQSALTAE